MSYTGDDRFLHHLELSEQALDRAREELSDPILPMPDADEQATAIILRWIESNERAEALCCQIITRAYDDAERMRASDPDPIEFYQPRIDAGDGIRAFFDSENPLDADSGYLTDNAGVFSSSVFNSLILYALDRVDWYTIVDHLRERMAEEA